jgi:hypothetical protein
MQPIVMRLPGVLAANTLDGTIWGNTEAAPNAVTAEVFKKLRRFSLPVFFPLFIFEDLPGKITYQPSDIYSRFWGRWQEQQETMENTCDFEGDLLTNGRKETNECYQGVHMGNVG